MRSLLRTLEKVSHAIYWHIAGRRYATDVVASAYARFLGRAPDVHEQQRHLTDFQNRSQSFSEFFYALTTSPEYQTRYLRRSLGERLSVDATMRAEVERTDALLASFIVDGYRGILGREPDEGAVSFYLPALRSGQLERSQFLLELAGRVEAKRRTVAAMDAAMWAEVQRSDAMLTSFIVDGYRGILGRDPDEGAVSFYLPALRSGQLERSQFLHELAERDEAKRRAMAALDAAMWAEAERSDAMLASFIVDGYRGILGRDPDEGSVPFYLPALRSGQLERRQFLHELAERDEAKRRTLAALDAAMWAEVERSDAMLTSFIVDGYRGILGREPDEGAVPFYLPALRSGQLERSQFLTELAERDEFKHRLFDAIKSQIEDGDFNGNSAILRPMVLFAYRGLLGREPNEHEINHYLSALSAGVLSVPELLREFSSLDEFRNKNIGFRVLSQIDEMRLIVENLASLQSGVQVDLPQRSSGALVASHLGTTVESLHELALSVEDASAAKRVTGAAELHAPPGIPGSRSEMPRIRSANKGQPLRVVYFTITPLDADTNGGAICCRSHIEELQADSDIQLYVVAAAHPMHRKGVLDYFNRLGIDGEFIAYETQFDEDVPLPEDTKRAPFAHEIDAWHQVHVQPRIMKRLVETRSEILLVDYVPSAFFCLDVYRHRLPVVTITLNDETNFHNEMVERKVPIYGRPAIAEAGQRLAVLERFIYESSSAVVTIGKYDLNAYSDISPYLLAPLIPLRPTLWKYSGKKSLLFVGNIGHFPNRQGLEWLATQFCPELLKLDPECKLRVIGASAEQVPENWRLPNIEYLGVSDKETVTRSFETEGLFIAPIANTFGAKMKVSECLSYACPTLATRNAMSGVVCLSWLPEIDLSKPKEAAEIAAELLGDAAKLTSMSHQIAHDLNEYNCEQQGRWGSTLRRILS